MGHKRILRENIFENIEGKYFLQEHGGGLVRAYEDIKGIFFLKILRVNIFCKSAGVGW